MSHDIFVSYSSKDKPVADAVCATLEARSIRCWIAPRDILPGTDYGAAIIDAITQSRFMVLVLSAHANESRQIIREVERAVNKNVIIIPFRIEDVVLSKSLEFFLSSPHWLDALTPPLEKHIDDLARTLLLLKGQPSFQSTTIPRSNTTHRATVEPGDTTGSLQSDSELTFQDLAGAPAKLVNRQVGSYILRQLIGAGGSGVVYRAVNPKLGLETCVKIFYPLRPDVANVARVIERGVRGVANLNHPNIVRIFDFDNLRLADGSSFFLVMELVRGATLSSWAEGRSPHDTLAMALKIAQALQAAHQCTYFDDAGFEQQGLLHGDIKPDNIMVRPDNSPVLLDFMMVDVQRLLDRTIVPYPQIDNISTAFGTPSYMAPEQEAKGIVTVKSDIYSLGKTFYQLFFRDEWVRIYAMDHANVAPKPDEPWPEVRPLLRRMTDDEPSLRPQNVSEIADQLARAAARRNLVEADPSASSNVTQTEPTRRLSETTFAGPSEFKGEVDTAELPRVSAEPRLDLFDNEGRIAGRFELTRARTLVGRAPVCEILLQNAMVSRQHAEVRKSDRQFTLVDLNSINGTLVNGRRITKPTLLFDGDQIQIGVGGPILRLSDPAPQAPLARAAVTSAPISYDIDANLSLRMPGSAAKFEAPQEELSIQTPNSVNTGSLRADSAAKPDAPLYLDDNVQFTVYRPKVIAPQKWYSLLAFAHLSEQRADAKEDEPDPVAEVRHQAEAMLGDQAAAYQNLTQDTLQAIPHEGLITFVPEMPGVEFNPARRSFTWEESVHREDFRLRAEDSAVDRVLKGRLSVFLGSILLADIPLSIRVDSRPAPAKQRLSLEETHARPYRKIFASYSHRDTEVVEQFERFAEALGDRYLRDVKYLRAGEMWGDRLEEMIVKADIFQLFWSTNSMDSPFVRQEWEYALSLHRPNFIRPTYWEEPLPARPDKKLPPEELTRLHFQRIQRGGETQGPRAEETKAFSYGAPAPPMSASPASFLDTDPEMTVIEDPDLTGGLETFWSKRSREKSAPGVGPGDTNELAAETADSSLEYFRASPAASDRDSLGRGASADYSHHSVSAMPMAAAPPPPKVSPEPTMSPMVGYAPRSGGPEALGALRSAPDSNKSGSFLVPILIMLAVVLLFLIGVLLYFVFR